MTPEKRLQLTLAKIEKRKQKLNEKGITEPSKLGYILRDMLAPVFRGAISLLYPKSGFVLLGCIDRKMIKKFTKNYPVIYSPAHRSVWDPARFIAYGLPHCYHFSGAEKQFYYTINELASEINGIIHFDRDDKNDRELANERGLKVLKSNHALLICPEGVTNIYENKC